METKLIIFDFDGTLADTRHNIVITMQATMEKLGLPVADEATCASTIGLPLRDGFVKIYPAMTDDMADKCRDTYREIFAVNKKKLVPLLFPGVKETLAYFHSAGVKMTIASSRTSVSLKEFAQEMGLDNYVDYIIGAEDVVNAKPNPEPVLKTIAALEEKVSRTFVVGDMPVDILMGKGAGTKTIGVTYGNATAAELKEADADFVIDDFRQLIDIIR